MADIRVCPVIVGNRAVSDGDHPCGNAGNHQDLEGKIRLFMPAYSRNKLLSFSHNAR